MSLPKDPQKALEYKERMSKIAKERGFGTQSQFRDSIDKIVARYFSAVTLEPFDYKSQTYEPKPLHVSSTVFTRRMTCVEKCGACCFRFTLDYLPSEAKTLPMEMWEFLEKRNVEFNGKLVEMVSDLQMDHENRFCRNLKLEDGRCGIHGNHPFSCDFELLRFRTRKEMSMLAHAPFGRKWNMTRIDGEKGALCEWYDKPCSQEWIDEIVRKMLRLKDWTDHFGLKTSIPQIISWMKRGPHERPLIIGSPAATGGFQIG